MLQSSKEVVYGLFCLMVVCLTVACMLWLAARFIGVMGHGTERSAGDSRDWTFCHCNGVGNGSSTGCSTPGWRFDAK